MALTRGVADPSRACHCGPKQFGSRTARRELSARLEVGEDFPAFGGVFQMKCHVVSGHELLRVGEPLLQRFDVPGDFGSLESVRVLKGSQRCGGPAVYPAKAGPFFIAIERVTPATAPF